MTPDRRAALTSIFLLALAVRNCRISENLRDYVLLKNIVSLGNISFYWLVFNFPMMSQKYGNKEGLKYLLK